ncbi:PaaX family transcriptional regulator [Agromyces bauzanensis]
MPSVQDADPSGPRRPSPTRQVLTIFGDYWWHTDAPLPSGALVAAMVDLGLKEGTARATLSRLVGRELLVVDRAGRRTTHRLTGRARAIIDDQADWLERFGRTEPEWDGFWSVLAFSIPESRRALRHAARSRLRWRGFALLYDGVWISPLDAADAARRELRELGVDDVTSMRARLTSSHPGGPQTAWDIAGIRRQYDAFLSVLDDGGVPDGAVATFAERSRLSLAWQNFRDVDVWLPSDLLPADWPRVRCRRRFAERFNRLGPVAEDRMRQHVSQIDPGLAEHVTPRRLDL